MITKKYLKVIEICFNFYIKIIKLIKNKIKKFKNTYILIINLI